jgi:divalent metal cation (Fe/Co/Zn/Cd) transporter
MSSKITASRVVLTSFFVDLLDIGLNVTIVLLTGSVVMVAEFFQAIADLTSSALLWVGLKRPEKEVYLWTILSALVMLIVASSLSFYFGLQRFLHPKEVENIFLAYAALLVAAISNGYAFAISVKRILGGKSVFSLVSAFHSSPFIMTKNTFVLDLMGMSSALAGTAALVLYQVFGDIRFDGLGAMGIGIILAVLSIHLILDLVRLTGGKSVHREI